MSEQYERSTLRLLRYVYNQIERCRNADFDALDITSSQASVMLYLFKNRNREVTQQSIQEALMLSHPTITGLMQRLELKGFISRTSNPKDCRCKFVQLTAKGCEIERSLKANTRGMEERALIGITPEELRTLDICLYSMAENLRKEEESIATTKLIREMRSQKKRLHA